MGVRTTWALSLLVCGSLAGCTEEAPEAPGLDAADERNERGRIPLPAPTPEGGLTIEREGPADDDASAGPAGESRFMRYPSDVLIAPVNAFVAERWREALVASEGQPDVFMKVGASGTVNSNFLRCFAGYGGWELNLDGRDTLNPTIDFFRGGEAADTTPFDRDTGAAVVGRSAVWATAGDPSPIDSEIAAIDPSSALINYGINDMQLGSTYRSALFAFIENYQVLLDELEARGVLPIVTSLTPRGDRADAARWVPAFNVATRAIAEARQLPYLNLYLAMTELPGMGLVGDGIHGNVAPGGPCDFTSEALDFHYNRRNLLTLELLDRIKRVGLDEADPPDGDGPRYSGEGTDDAPWAVDGLPFTHGADTSQSSTSARDSYPACDDGQDESGPEYLYELELDETTPVRLFVSDRGGVDVDIHVLDGVGTCIARNDGMIEGTLSAGRYQVVIDTFVSQNNGPRPGAYLFGALRCEAGDEDCAPSLR
ncbi:MAG: hypothetical protein AAGA56_04770 [Myxococcota bacterium]